MKPSADGVHDAREPLHLWREIARRLEPILLLPRVERVAHGLMASDRAIPPYAPMLDVLRESAPDVLLPH